MSALTRLSFSTLISYMLLQVPLIDAAATTRAACGSQYQWMQSSAYESPCLVASKLSAVCTGGDYFVTAIDSSNHSNNTYPHPTSETQNPCLCSTVVYMLYQACSVCQDGAYDRWSQWSLECASTTVGYSNPIPEGTVVQGWAYIDPRPADSFSLDSVQSQSTAPGSTGVTGATAVSGSAAAVSSTANTSTNSGVPTSSSSAPNTTGTSSSSNEGANKKSSPAPIIAGVVIALVVIALAIGGFFWYRRRRMQGKPKEIHTPIDEDGDLEGKMVAAGSAEELAASATPFIPDPNATPEPVDPVTARRANEKRRLQMAREQARRGQNVLPAPGSSSLSRSDTSAATTSASVGPSQPVRRGKGRSTPAAASPTANAGTGTQQAAPEEDEDDIPPPDQGAMTETDLNRLASRVVAMMAPSRPARNLDDDLPPVYERTPGSS